MKNILNNKTYLCLTEYFSGMSVMAVEVLGMHMIDGLITEEISYYKGIYEEQGLRGLIDSLL